MKITFTMSVRDELPELLNRLARQHGEPEEYERTRPIDLMREVDLPAVPRVGEMVWVTPGADPRTVQEVRWDLVTGDVRVSLGHLDTDELADEGAAVELLLDQGWEVDTEMMGWGPLKK